MSEHFENPMIGTGLDDVIVNYDYQGLMIDPVSVRERRQAEKKAKEAAQIKAEQRLMMDLGKEGSEFLRLHLERAISAIYRIINTEPMNNEKILFEVRDLQIVTRTIDQVIGKSRFKDQFARYAVLEIVTNILGVGLPAPGGGYQAQAPDVEEEENGRA